VVTITEDGYGVRAGFDDAPIEIEIFTEPQCNHCADLQADFGDQLAHFIAAGQLAVTYRPVTFLDIEADGHSARVANAMFVAASPSPDGDSPTGPAFQRFVEELWAAQDPGGAGPSDDDMADMARAAGVPDYQADEIASGDLSFDTAGMSDTNLEFLLDIDPLASGTPTVFSLTDDEKLDIYDDDWLSKLMAS
jgi:protein-disulfide isomerase